MSSRPETQAALDRLRAAGDQAAQGWWPTTWRPADGSTNLRMVASAINFSPAGAFDGLQLKPDSEFVASTRLELPEHIAAVPVASDALLATIDCLFPVDMQMDGRSVFSDALPVAATGPALFQVLPVARSGDNGELTIRIRTPPNQIRSDWLFVHFTTPSVIERFAVLDTAWAQLLLAAELAVTGTERAAVVAAAAAVPDHPANLSTTALSTALSGMATALAPVAHRVAKMRVHAIGHSHIDLAWCWTWDDSREVIKRDVRSVLALMDEFPEMRFTHSQPASYDVLRREEPELLAAVHDRVAEGRWEAATMQWVESDTNMPSGEAQSRQLLEAVDYTRRHLGTSPTVHLAPDTFGHAGNLPQLSTSAGALVYYHHRGNPGQASGGQLWPAYHWQGDDGTRLLAISSPVYLGPLTPGRVARDLLDLTSSGLPACAYFYGVGDHGGGPTRQSLQLLRRMQQTPGMPNIFCSTVQTFADDVQASGVRLPEHRGESATVFEGCYTTHADAKRYNRDAENQLITAETLSALAGHDHTAELAGSWRDTLFHQFHDIIDGSSIHEAYHKTAADFSRTAALTARVTEQALDSLQAAAEPGSVAVTNPLGFDRTDVAHLPGLTGNDAVTLIADNGRQTAGQYGPDGLRFIATVPAFATTAYRIADNDDTTSSIVLGEQTSLSYDGARYYSIDTPRFFALIRSDCGVITTLYDKRDGRELVGYNIARSVNCEQVRPDLALGALQLVDEYPHLMSSWVIDEVHAEQSVVRGAELTATETGPVRVVLTTRHTLRSSTVERRLVFYADLPRIDIELDVDWQELGDAQAGVPNLMLSFTTRQRDTQAWYETPFSAAQRPADGLTVPSLRWADIGNDQAGMAILNDGKYGFDALGSRLRVHVLRSAYDPDAISDLGWQDHSRYGMLPHTGHWSTAQIPQQAAGFNQPLLARLNNTAHTDIATFRPRLEAANSVVISILKFAHRGDGARVIRLYESAGKHTSARLTGLPGHARVFETTIVEDIQHRINTTNGTADLTFSPFQVRTLLIETP